MTRDLVEAALAWVAIRFALHRWHPWWKALGFYALLLFVISLAWGLAVALWKGGAE